MKQSSRKKGFTLIEIIIVIIVMAILAAVSIIAYNNAQSRSRDTIRVNDLSNMNNAIKMYYADQKQYPSFPAGCSGYWSSNTGNHYTNSVCTVANFIPDLVAKGFMSSLPADPGPADNSDPTQNTRFYGYRVDTSNYQNYKIIAHNPEECSAHHDIVDSGYPRDCWAWAYWGGSNGAGY